MEEKMRIAQYLVLCFLLTSCGLAPVYITVSPAASDGTFLWVAMDAQAPEGYAPVIFASSDGTSILHVCRADVFNDGRPRNLDLGFVVRTAERGQSACRVAESGRSVTVPAYEQLWAQAGAIYRWERVGVDDTPLATSRFVRSNRVVMTPINDPQQSNANFLWHPCVDEYNGTWYLGGISLGESAVYSCHFLAGDRVERTIGTALLLYAPVEQP